MTDLRARYSVRLTARPADIAAAQALRGLAFLGPGRGPDCDAFDPQCRHLLITRAADGAAVACCRVQVLPSGTAIDQSYAAQFYDLAALSRFPAPMVEMGRFCIRPGLRDPDILRLAWAALTRVIDAHGAGLLFGCASFAGTDPAPHADALALLGAVHRAPARWAPGRKGGPVIQLDIAGPTAPPDRRAGLAAMPSLLRSYLAMGGWVSDHAVIDPALNTLHVFTGVEIAAIPAARSRALRALAGAMPRDADLRTA